MSEIKATIINNNSKDRDNENYRNSNSKQKSKNSNDSFHPWIKPESKCYSTDGMLKLHYEILDFCEFIKLNDEEKELRKKTFNYIKNIIESKFPDYKCKLYGSFKSELSLPDSDIDVLILSEEASKDQISKNKLIDDALKKVHDLLFSTKSFSYLEIIKAKVPIIKCTYKETNIDVDICLFRKNGIYTLKTLEKILKSFPEIKSLIMVVKYTLRQRQLNQIYKGGISSFIIFSLVYYYIADVRKKLISNNKNNIKNNELTLGHLLVGFFDFYGFQFNYEKLGISIRNGGFLFERNDEGKNLLCIENPQDISQDMGKSCFRFRKVVETFKFARDSLYYPEKSPVVSYLSGFIFPDDLLKMRAFNNK